MAKKARSGQKMRLDDHLLRLGHFDDPKAVQASIMSGKVVVDGIVITKPGMPVNANANILIRGVKLRFASRGGYKLEKALLRFKIDVSGLVCMDAGASTGGFTDCLLQQGAKKVYAVEVGYGQLLGRLALDARVVSLERTNIGDVTPRQFDPPLDFACGDLSYLSLHKAVPILDALFLQPPHIVMLVKPLYEGLAQEDIAEPASLERVLAALVHDLAEIGRLPTNACASPLKGSRGAIEFLFQFGGAPVLSSEQAVVAAAMQDLIESPPVESGEFL